MTLFDLRSKDQWKQLEMEIHARSGMNAAVFDAAGARITDYANWGNSLCPRVKADPNGGKFICALANQAIMDQARRQGRPVIMECDAGLCKIAVPIFADNEFLGAAGCCGALFQGEEVDTFCVSKNTALDEDEARQLAQGVTIMTRDQADEVAAFISEQLDNGPAR